MLKTLFWFAVAIVAYVYAGYPLVLAAWSRLRPRPVRASTSTADLPGVSIVIAARNEAPRLAARLQNLLALDYPPDRRQIIVVSDGSTDDTRSVVARFAPAVELIDRPAAGKARALNAGVARARNEILVFADARQTFTRNALLALVRSFSDPTVGAVSGELVLDCEGPPAASDSSIGEGVGLYWRYEKWLRRHESLVGSTLGVSGAIYAMRKASWRPLPDDTLLDDVLAPMRVVLEGRRVVFEPAAIAYDRAAPDAETESRRKVRTLAGNYQLVWLEPRLLVPFVNPVWLQFVSHKLGRLIVPFALIVCLVTSAALASRGAIYLLALLGQMLVAVLAAYGAVLDSRDRRARRAARPRRHVPAPALRESAPKKAVNA